MGDNRVSKSGLQDSADAAYQVASLLEMSAREGNENQLSDD